MGARSSLPTRARANYGDQPACSETRASPRPSTVVRAGKAKAVTATARKIAVLLYNTLRYGMAYVDPGADYYEERYRKRTLENLRRRAESLGFSLVEAATSGGVS